MHDMVTYEPHDTTKLTKQEKHDVMESLLFITEERMGATKEEHALWVTINALSKDMTNRWGVPPQLLLEVPSSLLTFMCIKVEV